MVMLSLKGIKEWVAVDLERVGLAKNAFKEFFKREKYFKGEKYFLKIFRFGIYELYTPSDTPHA